MPKYYNSKYKYKQSPLDDQNDDPAEAINTQCPANPDLILLRNTAAAERNVIAFYFEAAMNTNFTDLFFTLAEDEMHNFYDTMQQISRLDPVQGTELTNAGLASLVMTRATQKVQVGPPPYCKEAVLSADTAVVNPPAKRDLPAIQYLTKALDDELIAINSYQTYMQQAQDPGVKVHFCELMTDEKRHTAELIAALFSLTNEPLPKPATQS